MVFDRRFPFFFIVCALISFAIGRFHRTERKKCSVNVTNKYNDKFLFMIWIFISKRIAIMVIILAMSYLRHFYTLSRLGLGIQSACGNLFASIKCSSPFSSMDLSLFSHILVLTCQPIWTKVNRICAYHILLGFYVSTLAALKATAGPLCVSNVKLLLVEQCFSSVSTSLNRFLLKASISL